jgi:hypothetical protein
MHCATEMTQLFQLSGTIQTKLQHNNCSNTILVSMHLQQSFEHVEVIRPEGMLLQNMVQN